MRKGKFYFIESFQASVDKKIFIQKFCEQYFYFSQNQIVAFSKLLQLLPSNDNEALALIASVIYDELGRGKPAGVHSVLFSNFAKRFGANLKKNTDDIVPGVKNYVIQLDQIFGGRSLPAALATYWFLEKSAVETYDPVLKLLKTNFPDLTENDLEFFTLHTEMEPEHEKAASEMNKRFLHTENDKDIYEKQVTNMSTLWDTFWTDITDHCLN